MRTTAKMKFNAYDKVLNFTIYLKNISALYRKCLANKTGQGSR